MASKSDWVKEKFYKIKEPTSPADPAVIARRPLYEAAAKWLANWVKPVEAIFCFLAFVVVLLPAISESWRQIILKAPITRMGFSKVCLPERLGTGDSGLYGIGVCAPETSG